MRRGAGRRPSRGNNYERHQRRPRINRDGHLIENSPEHFPELSSGKLNRDRRRDDYRRHQRGCVSREFSASERERQSPEEQPKQQEVATITGSAPEQEDNSGTERDQRSDGELHS